MTALQKLSPSDKLEMLILRGCQCAYYCLNESIITDYDFDLRLKLFEEKHPNLIPIGSSNPNSYSAGERGYALLMTFYKKI